jgi:2'-5' RNA ligase
MKAAIVLLSDFTVQNRARRMVFELNARHGVQFYASLLPAHVSLKQPFEFEDMDALEAYFDGLAARTAPFRIDLDRVYYEEWSGYAILGLSVVETPRLRGLHEQINTELAGLFKDTRAAHDGSGYHFHLTVEMGPTAGGNGFREYYQGLSSPQINLSFTAAQLGLFYYSGADIKAGSFISYRVQPLSGH